MKAKVGVLITIFAAHSFLQGCSSLNNTEKGAAVGTVGGAAVGTAIGSIFGKAGMGAIVGAAVGGTTGVVIGHKMDKQAEQLKKDLPNAKVERVGEGIVVEFSSKILFAVNKFDLSPEAKGNLNNLVAILVKNPDTDIEIQGHTDSTGSKQYNQTLSEKRAQSVKDYLVANNVGAQRLTVKGFGSDFPKYDNSTAEGRAQNRNVQFLISANEKMKADASKEATNQGN